MADKEKQAPSRDGYEHQPPSRLDGVTGVVRIKNPDPELWTLRSITSSQFSKSKNEDGPYRGTKRERY